MTQRTIIVYGNSIESIVVVLAHLTNGKSKTKQQQMFISEWFNRKYAKIYAAQVKEDIPYLFQWHVLVMRVTGLWPNDDDSRWYKYLTISIFICVGIGFGLSQLVNVLFVHTIERAMDSSFISLAVCATTVKAAIIYWQRNNIRNLFGIHKRFPRANEQAAYTIIIRIQIVMIIVYSTSWFFAVVQSVVADRESALFPSTAFWPHDFAHDRLVYWIVLSMQLVTSVGFCIWVTLADVFYIVLISTACDHLAQLKERLGNLGTTTGREEDLDFCFYMNLVECCERYEDCLRCVILTAILYKFVIHKNLYSIVSYASIMSNIMSPTLFMQFGLSGLGLCSSVYVLSVVSGAHFFLEYLRAVDIDSCSEGCKIESVLLFVAIFLN